MGNLYPGAKGDNKVESDGRAAARKVRDGQRLKPEEARQIWKRFGPEKVKALNAQGVSRDIFIEFAMRYGDDIFDAVEKVTKQNAQEQQPVAHDA